MCSYVCVYVGLALREPAYETGLRAVPALRGLAYGTGPFSPSKRDRPAKCKTKR